MDAVVYVSILEKTVLSVIQKLHRNGHVFIQDNDPKHMSTQVQQFFQDKGINWWRTTPKSPYCMVFVPERILSCLDQTPATGLFGTASTD